MNTHRIPAPLALLALLPLLTMRAHAQGSLTPPAGVPGLTMKSLDQIEARTAIPRSAAVPVAGPHYTIMSPGSYYLTGNLVVTAGDAIRIFSDNVTLDLNGFTISSAASPASGSGIVIGNDRSNIRIRNGIITGPTPPVAGAGFQSGILSGFSASRNIAVSDIHVSGAGIGGGIILNSKSAPGTLVERCTVNGSGAQGIVAHTVRSSQAVDCVIDAIAATIVSDSAGVSTGNGANSDGIEAREVCNCTGAAASGNGILASNVSNSTGTSTAATGIIATTASFCRGKRDGGVAISASIAIGCTVDGTGTVSSAQKHLGTP